jgi:diadenosine tetraphosphate (Ap4A) HIT family hydrolase
VNGFALDPRLAADSTWLADGPLSQLRLMDDARFPWLVLAPRLAGAVEWFDLAGPEQQQLLAEVGEAGRLLRALHPCEKINVGALGNIVRQLHVHVVARSTGDAAWPGPVWGSGAAVRMADSEIEERIGALRGALDPAFWSWRGP